jgi:hypothetical protein
MYLRFFRGGVGYSRNLERRDTNGILHVCHDSRVAKRHNKHIILLCFSTKKMIVISETYNKEGMIKNRRMAVESSWQELHEFQPEWCNSSPT